jgi:hypothetical protein
MADEAGAASVPRLGWRVARRPQPAFAHVLGAAAGAFAVVAIVAFVVEVTSTDPTAPGVAFTGALAVGALVAGFVVPGPIRSACVTAIVLSVPIVWVFAFLGGGTGDRGSVRGIYLLTLGTYLVLYLVGWTKGRSVLLAGVLLVFASWIGFEVAGSNSNSVVPFQQQITSADNSSGVSVSNNNSTISNPSDTTDSTATVALLIGLGFLGVGTALDRRKLEGAATPFIAVGAFETIVGSIVLGGNTSLLAGGIAAVGAGAVVGIVAARGDRRRATTWIGVLTVFGGLVAILVDISPDSAAGVGGIALAFAVALGIIAWRLAPLLGEPDDGDDAPVLPPTAPPGGESSTPALPTIGEAAA